MKLNQVAQAHDLDIVPGTPVYANPCNRLSSLLSLTPSFQLGVARAEPIGTASFSGFRRPRH